MENVTTIDEIKTHISHEWNIPAQYQHLKLENVDLTDTQKPLTSFKLDINSDDPNELYLKHSINLELITPNGGQPLELEDEDDNLETKSEDKKKSNVDKDYYSEDSDSEIGNSESRPNHGLAGLKNQGATCYLNSLFQTLYLTPEFRKMIYDHPTPFSKLLPQYLDPNYDPSGEDNRKVDKDVIFQMQLLFARMQIMKAEAFTTRGVTTSFGWHNSEIFVQHDVQELNRVLVDKLEERMKGKEKEYTLAKLYKGVTANLVKCMNCKKTSKREEDFYDIMLPIKGKKNITESLNEYIEVEELKGDNAYQCSNCNSKQTAQKFVKFKTLPPVLNVQLKRFEYDYNSEQRIKLNDEVSFPLKLKMDPYLIDPKLVEEKDFVIESPEYDLVAVLIHSGSAAVGHYYSFIKWENQWFKFNDETVTTADENDIKNQNWSGEKSSFSNFPSWGKSQKSANPYMLVYRKILKTPVTSSSDNDNKSKKQALDASPPILTRDSIPKPILNYLTKRMDERTKRKQDKEKESSIVNLVILRNSMEYPVKKLKIEKNGNIRTSETKSD